MNRPDFDVIVAGAGAGGAAAAWFLTQAGFRVLVVEKARLPRYKPCGGAVPRPTLDRFPFDSALVAASALDHFFNSFVEEFLPVAMAKGIGIIAMKVLGLGSLTHEVERSLRYAFGLPVSTVIVGMESMAQLEQNLAIAESFRPMTDEERLGFFKDIINLVRPEKMPWKAAEWGNPTEWVSRR